MGLLGCGQQGLLYSIKENLMDFFKCICREHCLLGSESLLLYVGKEETK